jgi:hypothetical protein
MDGSRKSEKNSLLCMNIRRKRINAKKEKTNVSGPERKRESICTGCGRHYQ